MKPRLILVSLGLAALSLIALGTQAQEPSKTPSKDDISTSEQQLKRQFADFQDILLRLKQRLARGTPEERKRAEVLGKVLDECRNLAINQEFTKMIELLRTARFDDLNKTTELTIQSDNLTRRLRKILDMLQDTRGSSLSEDRKKLEDILKALQAAIDAQRQTQTLTDLSKTDPKDLGKIQDGTTKKTADVGKSIEKYLDKDKDGQGGEAKNLTGKNKEGGEGAKGEAKDAGKPGEASKGETKGGGKSKEGGKQGAAKGGDDKKAGGEKKQGAPDASAKKGNPDSKQAGAKDSKAGEKASAPKAGGDPKAGDAKQGDAKSGDSKSGQAQAKDGGSPPKGGGGDPKEGQPSAKGGDSPPSSSPPSGDKQDQDVQKSQKKIKEAGYDQESASDKIKKGDNPKASKDQADAIDKLEQAKKNLEKLLQQMREEEIERVLAALQARCEKMLIMQKQVLAGTIDTDIAVKKNADKKANRENKLAALRLADQEKDIVQEANKCIDILESEGSAVAFPEVFQQIRQDMIHVQKRLELADVHDVTQDIERDIITTLQEMIEALKKAQDDNKDASKSKSKPGQGKQGDQKLLELLQELKMVRALQKRVNDRTKTYAKRFPGQEQANEPQIVRELRNLAERQLRIQDIVSRIAKGDNK